MSSAEVLRGAPEAIPIKHETSDRVVRTLVFGLPPAALAVAGWLMWGGALHWQDPLGLAIMYTLTGLGITVGYHRLFTHRSFRTTRPVRALLAVLGSMAVEAPVLEWVATHRKHHRFSDRAGDPHSPHLDHAPGWRRAPPGLLWGGAVRVFLLHHATFSINSLCHYFGRRPFRTGDHLASDVVWISPTRQQAKREPTA